MNPSEYVGVDAIILVHVEFTPDVDTSDALSRYLWSCCIRIMSPYVNYTITNGDRPLSAFNNASLFLISDAVQYIFTMVFTLVGYSGTSALSNVWNFLIAVDMTCAL